MKRTLLALVCSVGLIGGLTGCDDESIALDAVKRHFPQSQHAKAMDVIECESNFDPEAVSPGGGNHGLFQINTVHRQMVANMGYDWDPDIYNPYINTRVAKRIWSDAGRSWSPWPTCGR